MTQSPHAPRVWRWLEWFLCGIACCGAAIVGDSVLRRSQTAASVQAAVRAEPPRTVSHTAAGGTVLGSLTVPALHLRTPVLEGCDANTLERGSCRLSETAQIGGLGTVGIAGHRDASFRALQRVHLQDEVNIATANGTFHYQVDHTAVVQPEDVAVLQTSDRPGLVLITCYPFSYIGAAPKRFVVQAHLLSVDPSE